MMAVLFGIAFITLCMGVICYSLCIAASRADRVAEEFFEDRGDE